jgi:hypothetical protein
MMRSADMTKYYVSRGAVTAVVVALLLLAGSPWWMVTVVGVLVLGFFLLAPRSGRYALKAERGATALRRDEWTQAIVNKAGRNGFVALMLAAAAVAIYWGSVAKAGVPAFVLYLLVALGWVVYFASDVWLRRR